MRITDRAAEVTAWSRAFRTAGLRVGFVPTLGGLHEGHASLLRQARFECDRVIASVYLNPTQFDQRSDLESYPADSERDREVCREAGVDLLYEGRASELLPPGFQTWVTVDELTSPLCGQGRPGHFRGVTTIVTQLFHIVRPHRAYFGLKDFQQARVVARMVDDLRFGIEMRLLPIVREDDGLARSSRNARLTPEDRAAAPAIRGALVVAREAWEEGENRVSALRSLLRASLEREPRLSLEYAEVVRGDSLTDFPRGVVDLELGGVLLAVAARLGEVRLIDNEWIPPASRAGFGSPG